MRDRSRSFFRSRSSARRKTAQGKYGHRHLSRPRRMKNMSGVLARISGTALRARLAANDPALQRMHVLESIGFP